MRGTDRYAWIVLRGPGELLCERCEASYCPALPAPMNVYIAICKAFTRDHRHCKPPAEGFAEAVIVESR